MPLLELKFGKNLCYDILHYYTDSIIKNHGISQAAWTEILKNHIDNPEHAKKVASNIVTGMIEAGKVAKEAKKKIK